jgi:hypothetical protein
MTDNYVKFISEQVHKEKVRGFTNVSVNEDLEFESEEFDSIVEAVIDALAEDIQDLQELSPELRDRYIKKAGSQLFKAAYRAARDKPGSHTKKNTPIFTSDVKGHKDVKTINKREAGITRAAKAGGLSRAGGSAANIKYSGFEAGHDINTQRRNKVADHIDNAKHAVKMARRDSKGLKPGEKDNLK